MAAVVVVVLLGLGFLLLQNQSKTQTEVPTPTQAPIATDEAAMQDATESAEVMDEAEVDIVNFAYSPKTVTIKAGGQVTWTNKDAVAHTATADDGSFGTGLLAQGDSESVTFDKAGTYTYYCKPHPNMKATVVVE